MITLVIIGCIGVIVLAAVATNPFSRFSIVRMPFTAQFVGDSLRMSEKHQMIVRNHLWWRLFAYIKCGIHILETRYIRSPRSSSKTVMGIVKDIHKLRYNPNKLLVISGDHFSPLFVRNLGVFYYPLIDKSISTSRLDWQHRQIVYLQSVAFALEAFRQSGELTTTIVSTSPKGVSCVNFYAYPSDTLYGMLFALAALADKQTTQPYPYSQPRFELNTAAAASQLQRTYAESLHELYVSYRKTVFDERKGLIRLNVHLSGAKDITRRHSAFYDNVIFWKTTELAMRLGIIRSDKKFLSDLKHRILQKFWLSKEGYFLEDLSKEGVRYKYYSSDWLAVLFTGFLDPAKSSERHFFERSIAYVQQHGIDQPFAIKYQQDTRAHRQFLAVRLAVASYGGDAIWSFWGMEYIKVLLKLYELTEEGHYLDSADEHIRKYKQNMLRDRGFPEVYDNSGKLLQTPLYRSIRQTGWVIGFEQVLAIRKTIRSKA